jgi:hypothetical protein
MVINMVLCDQYKDGAGRLFDYPLYETGAEAGLRIRGSQNMVILD